MEQQRTARDWFDRTGEDDDKQKSADLRGTTADERGAILVALCRMAAEQIAQHRDPAKALQWQDPLSPETEALLQRLRRRYA